jgi:hypothetical protein
MQALVSKKLFWIPLVIVLLISVWLRVNDLNLYPMGLSNDEAVNVVDIFHIARTGNFPLYQDFGRPEPLYRMVLAIGAFFYGSDVVLDRYATALIGILTLATLYWAVLQMLQDVPPHIRHLCALIAVITLSLALGHITLSRALYRGILQPFFMLLSFGCLMRGLRTYRWREFVLSGVFLSLAIYSYTSALVVPLAFIPMGLGLFIFRWKDLKRWFPRVFVVGLVTIACTSPILYRLATQPVSVIGRAGDVSGRVIDWRLTYLAMVDQLFNMGDENPQYNVANAPIIPPAVQGLFMLGLLGLVLRLRHPSSPYLASLMFLVSVPAIASDELTHGLRVVGWFAVFPLIACLGIASLFVMVERFINTRWIVLGGSFIGVIFFGINAIQANNTYKDYWLNAETYAMWFVHNRDLDHNEWFFRQDKREFAEWLMQQTQPILIPIEELNRQTTRAWLTKKFTHVTSSSTISIPENTIMVMPYELETNSFMNTSLQFVLLENNTITILPPITPQNAETIISNTLNIGTEIPTQTRFNVLGISAPLNTPLEYQTLQPSSANFSNEIALTGWYGTNTLSAQPQTYTFTLSWQSIRPLLGHEYFSYLQLQTPNFEKITGHDQQILRWVYPTTLWQNSVSVPETYRLEIPQLEFGVYQLVTGIYPIFDLDKPLAVLDANNQPIRQSHTVAWLKVPLNDTTFPNENAVIVDAILGDAFELNHAELQNTGSNQYVLRLFWESLAERPNIDGTIFVHVVNVQGEIIAQSDLRPYDGRYPTFIWDENEELHTEHSFTLPSNDLSGLTIRIGMYTFPDIRNLIVVQNGKENPNSVVELGQFEDLLLE